jgi:hypothetical protein
MAKKARKKSAAKSKKAAKRKTKPLAKKPATKKRAVKKKKPAAPPKSFKDKVAGAYRTVIDTFKGTDELRNKLEPPATSETE